MICGSAAGKTTSCSSSRSLAPRLRADHSSSRSTASVAAMVAVITGKMASKTTIEIFDRSWKPSHSVMIGRNAIFGIGKPTEISGSSSQRAARLYTTAKPRPMPAIAATAKPASDRYIVRPRFFQRPPDAASVQMRSSTVLSVGSMNGVTAPLRAKSSQASARPRSGIQGAISRAMRAPGGRAAGTAGRQRSRGRKPTARRRTSRRTRRPRPGNRSGSRARRAPRSAPTRPAARR